MLLRPSAVEGSGGVDDDLAPNESLFLGGGQRGGLASNIERSGGQFQIRKAKVDLNVNGSEECLFAVLIDTLLIP